MLKFFRKSASLVKVFFGFMLLAICVSLVVTLIPGITGDSTDSNAIETVADVGGEKITTSDVQQGVQQLGRNSQLPPEMLSLYTEQVLDQLILEKASVLQAERMGLRVSEQDLRMRLQLIPELFPNGKFVGKEQYEALVQERMGSSIADWETRFRNNLMAEKLRNVVTDSIGVSPQEVRDAFVNDNEKLVISYVFLTAADFKKGITPTDPVLQEYFQKNADHYRLPEQRTAKVLLLDTQKIKEMTTVSDAEIQKYYQDHLDSYRVQERVSVHHILFRATDKEPEKLAAARKKAEDILKQLKAGAKFDDLAKKNSEDTASAVKGGDLGWVLKGQTVPNFEKAAFSLAPGALSEPVQTEYGIHILKVLEHEQARVKPLEEVKAEIQTQLLNEKVQANIATSAEQAAADWRKDPSKLDAIAKQYHGTVMTPPPFSRGESVQGIPGSEAISEDTFILDKGQIGRPVAITSGYAIPLLEQISPPRGPELSEVKEKVRSDYVDEQSKEKAQAKALELVQTLEKQEKRDLEKEARAMGLTAKKTDPLTRNQPLPSVGTVRDLGPRVDSIKPGEIAGPVPVAGGQVVYQLVSLQPPNEQDFAALSEPIRQKLLNDKQTTAFAVFQQNLKSHMMDSGDVKVYQPVVDRLNASIAR
jgi:peptidyl-prolyl cis-trans isomerase D